MVEDIEQVTKERLFSYSPKMAMQDRWAPTAGAWRS